MQQILTQLMCTASKTYIDCPFEMSPSMQVTAVIEVIAILQIFSYLVHYNTQALPKN